MRYRAIPSAYAGQAVANVLDTQLGHTCYQFARRVRRTLGYRRALRPKLSG
jgi:hypothetical protein